MRLSRAPRDWDGGRWVGCYDGRQQVITRIFQPAELRTPKVVSGWLRKVRAAIVIRDTTTIRRMWNETWGSGQALGKVLEAVSAGVITVRHDPDDSRK